MFDVFGTVKNFTKLDAVCIDNNVFRLHYKATFIILVAFSLIITSKQYIGDPIDCIVEEIPQNIMDTYCWIYSTYTIPNLKGIIGKNISHPGVGTKVPSNKDDVKYHKYYQWVCFALFFQGIMFYTPRYLWKIWEGGMMKVLVQDLSSPMLDNECKDQHKKLLVDYLYTHMSLHNFYVIKYLTCEFLNFVNVVMQIYFMDTFLEGEFSKYGSDVMWFSETHPEDRIDPMSRVFPKVTKCTFHKYGPSGGIQKFDGLCILPLNIVNEKIYVFLWFWFIILSILSGLNLLYHAAIVVVPKFRFAMIRARTRISAKRHLQVVNNRCQVGDWFVLYQLCKNIDSIIYKQLIEELAKKFEGKESV